MPVGPYKDITPLLKYIEKYIGAPLTDEARRLIEMCIWNIPGEPAPSWPEKDRERLHRLAESMVAEPPRLIAGIEPPSGERRYRDGAEASPVDWPEVATPISSRIGFHEMLHWIAHNQSRLYRNLFGIDK